MIASVGHLQGARVTISCTNCKARKKGCDLKKPNCTRCLRLGLVCQFPPRQYVFVEAVSTTSSSIDLATATTTPALSISPRVGMNASLLATNHALLAVEAFWAILLPMEKPDLDGSMGGLLAAPWVSTIRGMAETYSCVKLAMEACAYTSLGWSKDDQSLIQNATRPYLCAIQEVNKALQDPRQCVTDEVLAACRMLSLFEMLRKLPATGQQQQQAVRLSGWQTHAQGAYQLLRLRGQARHQTEQGHQLYDGVRIMGAIQGMSQRRANAFTELGWQVPQRDLRDELFDLMCTIPGVFEMTDSLLRDCSDTVNRALLKVNGNVILDHYLRLGRVLLAWETKALELCRQPLSGTSLYEQSDSHGYAFFFICQQYWACCLRVYSSCHILYTALQVYVRDVADLIEPPEWMDPEPCMLNIINTCSHFFTPQAGLWAAQASVFPLSSALMYLLRTGRCESPIFAMLLSTITSNKAGAVMSDFIQMVVTES